VWRRLGGSGMRQATVAIGVGIGGRRVAVEVWIVDFDFGVACWIREVEFASVARLMARMREDARRG